MSIRISSRGKATPQAKPTPVRTSYDSEEEEHSDDSHDDAPTVTKRSLKKLTSRKIDEDRSSEDELQANKEDEDIEYKRDDYTENNNSYPNGVTSEPGKLQKETPTIPKQEKKEPPLVAGKPVGSIVPAIMSKAPKNWPPPAPKTYDAFAVEGHGRMNPYTGELIPDKQKEEQQPEEDKRLEIDEGHTQPVNQLKKNWQGKKTVPGLGVNRPQATVQQNKSWIKHEKPPVEYEEPPKEPDWLKLVRNRRWNSTVKARFPCKNTDIVDFERRSTTPKNWKRLLLDKKAVRTIGEITGIGAEGEELLWRLAKQRGKVDEGASEVEQLPIPGQQDTLAYEHIKQNLEAAVVEAAIQAGIDPNDYPEDGESVVSQDSGENERKQSTSASITTNTLRQRLLRLHPEEFKKLLALDRARDAHLRWQFSTDPYDSVHEHQLQPFEMALLSGERENRLRYLLKKLLKAENMPASATSSGRSTPVFGKSRGRSLSTSYNVSDQESDSGSSVSSARRSRAKKKPPVPLPRKGRSVSPSYRNQKDEEVHGFLGPDDELITSELRKLEEMGLGKGLPPEISDLLNQKSGRSDERRAKKERPQDAITIGLDDRMRSFLNESDNQKLAKSTNEKEQPLDSITRSLVDRKTSFLDEAQKAATRQPRKTEESDLDEPEGGRVSDIDTDEISSRRRRFLDQERQAKTEGSIPGKEKKRHKVQRIKSDAELYAVLSKRRMATDEEETAEEEHSSEVKGLLEDITKTFGGQTYTRIGKRKPRFQSSDEGDSTQLSESVEEDEEHEEEAPARRPARNRETKGSSDSARRQRRGRTRDWSESEESDEDEKDER